MPTDQDRLALVTGRDRVPHPLPPDLWSPPTRRSYPSAATNGSSGTTSVQPFGTPADSLTITVRASAEAPAKTWTLTCDPPGGTHPKAADACAALTKAKDPFKPVPKDQMCTDIYGGPEIATVKGTWHNKPIDTKFTREDGCQLHRWTEIGPLFGNVPKVR